MRYVAAIVVLVIVAVGVVAGVRWTSSVPAPTFAGHVASEVVAPGIPPRLPWPQMGSAAVAVKGLGLVGSYGTSSPQAIASIAKVMTAEIILKDHPLAETANGPGISFSASDAATYRTDLAQSQSVIKVVAGESLSERQALEALLIPSANNIAIRLAAWDSSSTSAFVAKMNTAAKALGLSATHFTDPSGLEDSTTSVPADLIKLGESAMSNAAFAAIVDMPQVTLPYNGTVYNFDYDLGRDGIIGIKTGSDSAAGGCFLFEAVGKAGGRKVEVFGAVLGQETRSPITAALDEAKALVVAALKVPRTIQIVPDAEVVGHISTAWSSSVAVQTTGALSVYGWPGEKFTETLQHTDKFGTNIASGTQIGTLVLHVRGRDESTPVKTIGSIKGPSGSWKLEH